MELPPGESPLQPFEGIVFQDPCLIRHIVGVGEIGPQAHECTTEVEEVCPQELHGEAVVTELYGFSTGQGVWQGFEIVIELIHSLPVGDSPTAHIEHLIVIVMVIGLRHRRNENGDTEQQREFRCSETHRKLVGWIPEDHDRGPLTPPGDIALHYGVEQ